MASPEGAVVDAFASTGEAIVSSVNNMGIKSGRCWSKVIVGLADKKPRPTKEISVKLFGAAGGSQAKKSIELKSADAGLVRSTDVFSGGEALGNGEKSAPIVDWDAMAAHARDAARPLTLGEIFSRDGRYYFISRPLLITLAAGIIGGIAVCMAAHYTDRISYWQYSERGHELLKQKEARPAVEYFLSQSNRTELESGSGSPYHIASLEGLAQAYANDKCYASADETFTRLIHILRTAPVRDDVRLAAALEHYAEFLRDQKKNVDARETQLEARRLQQSNTGGHWIWFFAIIAFVFEAIYMTGVLIAGKSRLENWPVYAGFTLMGMIGIAVGLFKLGAPIVAALAGSFVVCYVLLPFVLVAACAVGKSMPAFHVLTPTRKRK